MKFFKITAFIVAFYFAGLSTAVSQDLEQLPPVLQDSVQYNDSSTSFMFTAVDFGPEAFRIPAAYSNCIQIFDADAPWPPRWFCSIPLPANRAENVGPRSGINLFSDARLQQGYYNFYRVEKSHIKNRVDTVGASEIAGFIKLNTQMEAVDTLNSGDGNTFDPHDCRVNAKGERVLMAYLDTVLDISSASGNPADTAKPSTVTLIEIIDSTGKMVFRWNSAQVLGANSVYYPDLRSGTFFKRRNIDWAHGTGVLFDTDGNILYCFRFVGIGKISRQDGHVIWRFDRRNCPVISGKDTMEFYSQHDFEALGDTGNYNYYSVYSNGKEPDLTACALIFRVNKLTGHIELVGKRRPYEPLIAGGAGNYEPLTNGNYLLSYGQYPPRDSSKRFHYFMELRHNNEKLFARYKLPNMVFSWKVHPLNKVRPPRPEISRDKKGLLAKGDMKEWTWYSLSGPDNRQATEVGKGEQFKPHSKGVYCVAGKYGIGWSVSKAILFNPDGQVKGKK